LATSSSASAPTAACAASCYLFDALNPGGPWRNVVVEEAVWIARRSVDRALRLGEFLIPEEMRIELDRMGDVRRHPCPHGRLSDAVADMTDVDGIPPPRRPGGLRFS